MSDTEKMLADLEDIFINLQHEREEEWDALDSKSQEKLTQAFADEGNRINALHAEIRARLLAYDALQEKHDKLKTKVEEWQRRSAGLIEVRSRDKSNLDNFALALLENICDYREGE